MSIRTRRTFFSLIIFFAVCALGGMVLSQQVAAQSATDESTLRDSPQASSPTSTAWSSRTTPSRWTGDKIDRAIYDGAIPGMLHALDPHSNFYDPKAFAQMREEQHGKYYGVGMSIQP